MVQGSRSKHSFDLLARKDGWSIPIDIRVASRGSVGLEDVLETYAKSMDAELRPAIVVAMPAASPDAQKTSYALGIVLVEGSAQDVLEKLEDAIDEIPERKD